MNPLFWIFFMQLHNCECSAEMYVFLQEICGKTVSFEWSEINSCSCISTNNGLDSLQQNIQRGPPPEKPNRNVCSVQRAQGFLYGCACYILPPPNHACVCVVVGTSLMEGSEWKQSTAHRVRRVRWAQGLASTTDNWRVLAYLTRQPGCQLHCFTALQGCRALSPAQWVGSESGTWGSPRVLRCASSAAGPSLGRQN